MSQSDDNAEPGDDRLSSLPAFIGNEPPLPPKKRPMLRWLLLGGLALLIVCQVVFWPWIRDNEIAKTIGLFAIVAAIVGSFVFVKCAPHWGGPGE